MSNGRIPQSPEWCSYCRPSSKYPCDHHKDGKPYEGSDVYQPSEWVLEVVGERYNSITGPVLCFGYDPRHGFWVRDEQTGEERNVSERAIGRSLHRIRD